MPSQKTSYEPNPVLAKNAYVSSFAQYKQMYRDSLDNSEGFWKEIAQQFHWETPFEQKNFFRYNFDITKGPIFTKLMNGATTNITYNLLDRNIRNGYGERIAYYW